MVEKHENNYVALLTYSNHSNVGRGGEKYTQGKELYRWQSLEGRANGQSNLEKAGRRKIHTRDLTCVMGFGDRAEKQGQPGRHGEGGWGSIVPLTKFIRPPQPRRHMGSPYVRSRMLLTLKALIHKNIAAHSKPKERDEKKKEKK